MNADAPAHISRKWIRLKFIEWLIVGVIVVILAALLLPAPKWGGSGFIDVPIRVVVFDATQGEPIKDARVAIQKYSSDPIEGVLPKIAPELFEEIDSSEFRVTDVHGVVTIPLNLMYEVNHKSPDPFVYLFSHWIVVSAEDFAPVITTLRYDTERTEKLRNRGGIVVAIGLFRESEE